MAFHDVRLPVDVERGAVGGPRFKTTVLSLSSGHEKRNIEWENIRSFFDVGYGIESKEDFKDVIEFFYARQGKAHSFRFKDWSDFEVARQSIGTTDSSTATFQVFKRYTSGGVNFDRELNKIVSGSVSLWVNDVAIDQGGGADEYTIDLLTGIVTLGSTLAGQSATDIEIECEFDIATRFDTDSLDINMQVFNAGSIPQIAIMEVRGE
jgi:uncharacterized protein (TIGR02217 family)